jgi:protein phosphatase 1L
MAFASSFYLYIKWRESKTNSSSDNAEATTHKLQHSIQYTRLSHILQQYSRIFAATANLPSSSSVRSLGEAEIESTTPGGKVAELGTSPHAKSDLSTIQSGQWFETGFRHQAEQADPNGPWSYKRDNIAVYAVKGRRPTMEDRFSIVDDESNNGKRFLGFAVYDGHGGAFLANYAERYILPSIIKSYVNTPDENKVDVNVSQLLSEEIVRNDEMAMEKGGLGQDLSGSTALVGVLHKEKLYIANVGDSRAVATKAGTLDEALQITMDHKPNQIGELERIKAAGGWVAFNGVWRVGGILAVSRALGDAYLKKFGWLTATPDVFVIDLKRLPIPYIILASDGLWDVFSSQEAVEFVSPFVENEDLFGAKQLAEKAMKKGSSDNVTVMIVKLPSQAA